MPKRIAIESHLSLEELLTRYRQASDPVERSHSQIIWLLACGSSPKEVAQVTGYSRQWIYELMSNLLGRKVSPQRGWEYLREMRFRGRVPRPHHEGSSEAEKEAWKKKLDNEAQKLQNQYPAADVEVWSEDEHRLGLKPVMRRIWIEEGLQPIAQVNWRNEVALASGVRPSAHWGNLLVDYPSY